MKNIIVILILNLTLFSSCKQKEEQVITNNTTEIPVEAVNEKLCFLSVTSRDSIILNVTRNENNITGIFNILPYEKDKKISTFEGTITGNTANVMGKYRAEGMEYEEELVFTIENNKASVKFGEMIEAENGVWKYRDIAKTSATILDKVNCK